MLDAEERGFVEPRLAHLLGPRGRPAGDRQDLFAAWRLFFERLADTSPTVLAFEDMHWADDEPARLRRVPARVVARLPALRDHARAARAAGAPARLGRRPAQLHVALPGAAPERARWRSCWTGSCPACPTRLRRSDPRARRRRPPVRGGDGAHAARPRPARRRTAPSTGRPGEIETLEVPETLHALIAARLDGLSPEERRLLQDGAVLGKTFTQARASGARGLPDGELEPLLASLVRKEVLGVQSDPRSPEHGQYGFLQDLVRHVAYETLSKRERKARHLAAAEHLEDAFADEDEVAEVARLALPRCRRGRARRRGRRRDPGEGAARCSRRAGERAASLGAPDEGAALLRAGGRAWPTSRSRRRSCSSRPAGLRSQANRLGRGPGAPRASDRAATRQAGDSTRACRRASAALADVDARRRPPRRRRPPASSRPSPGSTEGEPDAVARWRRSLSSAACIALAGHSEAAVAHARARTDARGAPAAARASSSRRLTSKGGRRSP